MKIKKFFCFWAVFLFFFPLFAFAGEITAIPAFTKNDRVLILAPHPDDETLGAGGAIQRALASGARVQVVCYTNGDHNELAFIVYEKRITFRTREFLYMGELRRKETIEAMTSLGLNRDELIFLGYPDFGTLAILTQFWQTSKPYWSILTRISKVSYPDALSPGAPYVGESILKDLLTVVENFKPTKIFVSHPADTNRDHQSLYLFTRIVLWELEGKIIEPEVYPYLIHVIGWPKPRGHHLNLSLKPPQSLEGFFWQQLALTNEEAKRKQTLVDFYKTEIEYNPPYLYSYVRENELFSDFPEINLGEGKSDAVVWHDVGVPGGGYLTKKNGQRGKPQPVLSGLSYALKGKDLLVRFDLRRKLDKNLGVSMYLLGYKKNVPFADMPKINIGIGLLGLRIRDKSQLISVPEAKLKFEGRSLILNIPLAVLGAPDRILSRVKARTAKFSLDASTWRILRIK